MTKNEVEFLAPLWGRTMHMVLDLVLLIASFEIIYYINGHLQPMLCPLECTSLITYNHPTLVPLTQTRTCLRAWLVQCLIIWVIFEQVSHIKCVRDISIIQWLKHISIVINFHAIQKGSYLHFSNLDRIPRKCFAADVLSLNHIIETLSHVDARLHQPCAQHWQPLNELEPWHESTNTFLPHFPLLYSFLPLQP